MMDADFSKQLCFLITVLERLFRIITKNCDDPDNVQEGMKAVYVRLLLL